MNNFKEYYQNSMNELPRYSIEVESLLDEVEHKKRIIRRRKQKAISALLSFTVIFICGAGTISAADYIQNRIRVTENGFQSGDAQTMRAAQDEAKISRMSDGEIAVAAETDVASPVAPLDAPVADTELEKTQSVETREYDSWESFEENEEIVFAKPLIPVQVVEELHIQVEEYPESVQFYQRSVEGKVVILNSSNYSDAFSHSSSTIYGNEVINQREYTTKQGFTYTLIDTVGETSTEFGVHGAIAIGSYEIYIDFWGYTEEEALQMMESMDLTVYKTKHK